MTDFIAPPERETGDLVTAAIWNQDVVANTQALFDEKFGRAADYDSGWFAVVYNTTYTKAHGLAAAPIEIILWHAAVAAPGAGHELVRVTDVKDGVGDVNFIGADGTNIYIKTGLDSTRGTVLSTRRSSAAGYYRVMAWEG